MFGPGAYRPDPTEGITAIADLPPPEIVPYSRNDKRQRVSALWSRGLSGQAVPADAARLGQSRPVVSA